jgi:hypothetical protein
MVSVKAVPTETIRELSLMVTGWPATSITVTPGPLFWDEFDRQPPSQSAQNSESTSVQANLNFICDLNERV